MKDARIGIGQNELIRLITESSMEVFRSEMGLEDMSNDEVMSLSISASIAAVSAVRKYVDGMDGSAPAPAPEIAAAPPAPKQSQGNGELRDGVQERNGRAILDPHEPDTRTVGRNNVRVKDILDARREGLSMEQMAEKLGCSVTPIRDTLIREYDRTGDESINPSTATGRRKKVDVDVNEIIRLRGIGYNQAEIARKLGVSAGVVFSRLKELRLKDLKAKNEITEADATDLIS